MSDDIDSLKQTEKEKLADWERDFASELDVAQMKVEAEAAPTEGPVKEPGEAWHTWVALMLIAFGLLALFGGFHIGFGWWWIFIFLGPWLWGKGGCGRNCW